MTDRDLESMVLFDVVRVGRNWSLRCIGCLREWPWRIGAPADVVMRGAIEHCCEAITWATRDENAGPSDTAGTETVETFTLPDKGATGFLAWVDREGADQ